MNKFPIKASIPTLRPGDVITKLACGKHATDQILVLERNQTDSSFDFSVHGPKLNIVKDGKGPFRWSSHADTFIDKNGQPHCHVNRESVVIQAAGMTEIQWYRDLPAQDDTRFLISPDSLFDASDRANKAKAEAILARSFGAVSTAFDGMQQALALALGGTEVSEAQMRNLMIVINLYIGDVAMKLEKASLDQMVDSLFSQLAAGMRGARGMGIDDDFGSSLDIPGMGSGNADSFGGYGPRPNQSRRVHRPASAERY